MNIIFNIIKKMRLTFFAADVIFVTEELPHHCFSREGNDLVLVWKLTLEDALMGTVVTVNTLDDRVVRVPITDVVKLVAKFPSIKLFQ